MGKYQNFKLASYVYAYYIDRATPEKIKSDLAFHQKHVGLDKVYLETHRALVNIPEEKMKKYMHAFMMLLTMNTTSILPFFEKRNKQKVISFLADLELCDSNGEALSPDSEKASAYRELAECYIKSCTSSSSYGSAFGGMIHAQDKDVLRRISEDIDTALKIVPKAYELGDVARPLYDIFSDTFHSLCGTI